MNTVNELEKLKTKDLDVGLIFSGTTSGKKINGYASPYSFSPTINPEYLYHESSRDVIVWFRNSSAPFYLFGSAGRQFGTCKLCLESYIESHSNSKYDFYVIYQGLLASSQLTTVR